MATIGAAKSAVKNMKQIQVSNSTLAPTRATPQWIGVKTKTAEHKLRDLMLKDLSDKN
jgi:hypothetical protein